MERLTTVSLADRCKSLIGKDSNYALAKYLDINITTVGNWYKRGMVMDDQTGLRVADALGLDPETVLVWLQFERVSKRGDDRLSLHWQHIAERIPA